MSRLAEILWKHRLKMLGAVAFLLFAGWITWSLCVPRRDRQVEAIQRKGYPVTLAELDAWYPAVPQKENAALIYTNAFALMTTNGPFFSTNYFNSSWPSSGKRLTPEEQQALATFLATNGAALTLLQSVPAGARSRYPMDMRDGFNVMLPHLAQVKRSTQLLANEALLHAANGDAEKATQAFLAAGRVADSLSQEPILISYLVRIVSWSFPVARLERILEMAPFTDEQLAALQKAVAEAEQPQGFLRAMVGEQAFGLAILTDRQAQNAVFIGANSSNSARQRPSFHVAALFGLYRATGLLQKDKAYYLDTIGTAITAAEAPYPERFTLGEKSTAAFTNPPSRVCIFSRLLLPALARCHTRDADFAARVRIATAALAVERFRRAHGGALPDSLEALVPACLPAVPADPYDGKPLRYTRNGAAYAVYSIGINLKDDGGVSWNGSKMKVPQDIVFLVQHGE